MNELVKTINQKRIGSFVLIMARRRNEKSVPELALGICMFAVAITMFNPKLREQIFSTFATIVAVFIVLGIIGGAIYFIAQDLIAKTKSASAPFKRSPLLKPVDEYTGGPSLNFDAEKQISATDIDKTQTWDVSILKEIEWKRFEKICTEYLRMAGYIAQETNIGADGGVDIHVKKPSDENFKGIVQCKAWNTYKVGVKPIRELFGIMAAERISTGIFITSGDFTSEAEEFAKGKINLVWGEKFINLIKKLSEDDQKGLLDVALDGDYRTPTCPQCDIKMALRESKKGRNAGGQFWGCVRYPQCRQTLIYKEI
jgi:restriction system protein